MFAITCTSGLGDVERERERAGDFNIFRRQLADFYIGANNTLKIL